MENSSDIIHQIRSKYPQIDITMGLGESEGLEELVNRSGLSQPPYKERFNKLNQVATVVTAAELMWNNLQSNHRRESQPPLILGLSMMRHAAASTERALRGVSWDWYYEKYNLSIIKPDTNKFMKAVSEEGMPILFLVPPDLFEHPDANVTAQEMEWLLNNPERANRVTLVFGAYDMVCPNWIRNRSWILGHSDKIQFEIAKAMLGWVNIVLGEKGQTSSSRRSQNV